MTRKDKFCEFCGLNTGMHVILGGKRQCPPRHMWPHLEDVEPSSAQPPAAGAQGRADGANVRQVGGDHYKNGGEEHWDRVARLNLDYFQGQITKYVERWRKKNGVEDLKKAQHFLEKYIELVEQGKVS